MSSAQEKEAAKEDDYGTKFLENLAWVAVGAAAVVVAFFIGNFAREGVSTDPAEWGQFGDYVGGLLNPTFSLIALLVLIKTMRLQVKELNQAHQEMKNSADALKAQQETMELQRFETTFFNLLEQIKETRVAFEKENGVRLMDKTIRNLIADIYHSKQKTIPITEDDLVKFQLPDDVQSHIKSLFIDTNNRSSLLDFIDILLALLEQVDSINIKNGKYIKIIKGFLSNNQKIYLFYFVLNQFFIREDGYINNTKLIQKYQLLSWLPNLQLAPLYTKIPKSFFDGEQYPNLWKNEYLLNLTKYSIREIQGFLAIGMEITKHIDECESNNQGSPLTAIVNQMPEDFKSMAFSYLEDSTPFQSLIFPNRYRYPDPEDDTIQTWKNSYPIGILIFGLFERLKENLSLLKTLEEKVNESGDLDNEDSEKLKTVLLFIKDIRQQIENELGSEWTLV